MKKVNNEFHCKICDKYYKSINSLCNHNRKFHKKNEPKNNQNEHFSENAEPKNNIKMFEKSVYKCKYCNKEYKYSQSKNRHQKKCENDIKIKNEELKKNISELKLNFENEFKKQISDMKKEMMDIINKTCKMHPKTLQKINNQLNNCNIINIVHFGKEDIMNTLSKKEKIKILNNGYQSFNKLIECVHFNDKYPQFKNIAITNLKDNIAYKYDNMDNKFIACKKDELLEDLMDIRTIDLEEIVNENIETISNVKVSKLKSLIEKLYDKEDFYNNKKSDIKLMIYNKSEKDKIITV
jgi:hypothetical protein